MTPLKLKISLRSLRDYAFESKSNNRAEKMLEKTAKRNYFTDTGSRMGDLISRPSLKFTIFLFLPGIMYTMSTI